MVWASRGLQIKRDDWQTANEVDYAYLQPAITTPCFYTEPKALWIQKLDVSQCWLAVCPHVQVGCLAATPLPELHA